MKATFLKILFALLLTVSFQAHAADEIVAPVVKAKPAEEAVKVEPAEEKAKEPVAEAPKEENIPVPPPSKMQAKDNCGGAENYLGLRIYGKGETPLAGSNKIDVSKLPMATRVFMPDDERPPAFGTGKNSDPKRLNLIIDHRNVISEAFCG